MEQYFDGFCQQANGGAAKSKRKKQARRDKSFLTRLSRKQASYGRTSRSGANFE